MKKNLVFLLLCMIASITLQAQIFGNEWIQYNQTYFKCKIAKDSIYRISVATLQNAGLQSNVSGASLQVFRDGVEIPIFVSNAGILSSTDYIEFYGEKADGSLDTRLYKNTQLQLNPNQNLVSDTAVYFITYNNASTNKRFTVFPNNTNNPPLKEAFFWKKIRFDYRTEFSMGKSDNTGASQNPALYTLNSSQYEEEGFVKKFTTAKDSIIFTCPNPYTVTGGPFGYFKTAVVGKNFYTNHQMRIYANNNLVADSVYGSFDIKRFNIGIPVSYINAQNKVTFRYEPILNSNDRFGIAYAEFRYPSLYNFENKKYYTFELEPKLTDFYLEISNFNHGGVAPILYDIVGQNYISGDITTAGLVKFVLPASTTTKKFILIAQNSQLSADISSVEPVQFRNYTQAANQGNYIMISQKALTNDGNGNNYLAAYKQYRESSAGGAHQVSLAFVDEIYNEFGYGYDFSTLAIKNFLQFAAQNQSWSNKPKFVFLIGKGLKYYEYTKFTAAPFSSYPFYPVPSFGHPCSDLLLTDFTKNNKPEIPIGRLSAFNGSDIKLYLDKIKDHEAVVNNTFNQTSTEKLWQKRILHIAGTSKLEEQIPILASLGRMESIITKPYFGGHVATIKKSSTSTVESINSKVIDDAINQGVGIVHFFGHSSAIGLDYNLDNPAQFLNNKKYFFMIASGCGAGNIFEFTGRKYLSEEFVFAPNAAAIGFIANVNTGFSSTLGTYNDSLYMHIAKTNYGETIGEQLQKNVFNFMNNIQYANDPLFTMHCQQILLNGDPATLMYGFQKPDYAVEEDGVIFNQTNLTSSLDSIDVQIFIHNLGKYTTDSVSLLVKRYLPNNIENIVLNVKYPGIANSDTIHLKIPTYGLNGLGQNYVSVELDQEGVIDEITETNNKITRYFTIYNDDLVPVYPYPYSIVNMQGVVLKGSTLNPFSSSKTYVFQIDTTALFNSPLLQSNKIVSAGGVIKWQPSITLRDSTVYYWRTAMDTSTSNSQFKWTVSSFIYLDQSLPGWNQSHYYQLKNSSYADMYLDSTDRAFKFIGTNKKIGVQNACMNGPSPYNYSWPDYYVKIDGTTIYTFGCDPYPGYSSLQFMVIDTLTGEPWINKRPDPNVAVGRFGSFDPCRIGVQFANTDPFFEFSFATAPINGVTVSATDWRKRIMNFIDSIPKGYYIMVQPRLCVGAGCGSKNAVFINQWKADTLNLGMNQSLYHKIVGLGFTQIDSFYKNRSMIFFARKGMPTTAQQFIGADSTVKLYAEMNFNSTLFNGSITSPKIGPAKSWSQLKQVKKSLDVVSGDSTVYKIIGITLKGVESELAFVTGDTSLQFIDAKIYPYLKLVMLNADNYHKTAEQLKYWRIHYLPQPEAALNPNRYFVSKDTLGQGQTAKLSFAIENLTDIPMDSMLVKYSLINASNNQRTLLAAKRYKPLPILDTIIVDYDFDSKKYTALQTLEIEVNPDDDQLEQYHPNNFGLRPLYIIPDNKNPLLDVTFDGTHILDHDIVSAKPVINIILKDENKYLALDDTSLVSVYLRYNASTSFTDEYIPFDNSRLKFFPATLSQGNVQNQARVEFRPVFTKDGDDYMLIVKAKDKSGNIAGSNEYKVSFRVVTQSSISSLLNYPNPFTTSTQFLFTLTGSEIPSNLKIQIFTPTGKVVREITRAELGNLHIGRNLTEFRWKGDDQFGQPLANGVYLYRFVTNNNGQQIEHFSTGADKYIEKGFGKLYIMR